MKKEKPLFIAAIVFGAFGLILLIFAAVIFISKYTSVYSDLSEFFGLAKTAVTTESICEIASLFEACAFLLGYKSYTEEISQEE